MLAHSFDRFYEVTKFIIPSLGGLKFSDLNYDNMCAYLDNKNVQNTETRKYMLNLRTFCKKIEPFVIYYERLINSYNKTVHNILENEINLLLPQITRKHKCGIITTLVSSFIGLAYKTYLVSYIIGETKPYIRQLMPWIARLIFSEISSCN